MERKEQMYICEKCGKKYASKADMYRCMANDLDDETAVRNEKNEKFASWTSRLRTIKNEVDTLNEKLPENKKIYFHVELDGHNIGASIGSKFSKKDTTKVKEGSAKTCKHCDDKNCKCQSTKKDPFDLNLLNFTKYDSEKLARGVKSAKTWQDLGLFDDIRALAGKNFSDEELTTLFNEAMRDPEISKLADDLQKKTEKKNSDDEWLEFFNRWLEEEEDR